VINGPTSEHSEATPSSHARERAERFHPHIALISDTRFIIALSVHNYIIFYAFNKSIEPARPDDRPQQLLSAAPLVPLWES
jgi:hypothetical protein